MSRLEPVIGTEIINDIRLGHTWSEYSTLRNFILKKRPDWFVEVGIHEGGLAYLLLPVLGDIKYMGIEINCGLIRPRVKLRFENYLDAKLICADCFSSSVAIEINNLFLARKIIYCDGGNKVKELKHFKYFCHPGDIIMAHDFHDGHRKVSGIPEIHPEVLPMDIVHLDTDETFTRLNEDIFKETRIVGWRKI